METKQNQQPNKVVNPFNPEQKLSYEELDNLCVRLCVQLQQSKMGNVFKRLDYLFKVLQLENVFKDPEFIGNCAQEVKDLISIPKEEPKA